MNIYKSKLQNFLDRVVSADISVDELRSILSFVRDFCETLESRIYSLEHENSDLINYSRCSYSRMPPKELSEMDKFILQNGASMTTKQMIHYLQVTRETIRTKCRKLGVTPLKRPNRSGRQPQRSQYNRKEIPSEKVDFFIEQMEYYCSQCSRDTEKTSCRILTQAYNGTHPAQWIIDGDKVTCNKFSVAEKDDIDEPIINRAAVLDSRI